MSRLTGLLDRARGFLSGRPTAAKDAIVHNRFGVLHTVTLPAVLDHHVNYLNGCRFFRTG